jgi:hypothetical protein
MQLMGYKVSFNSINGMTLRPEDIYQRPQPSHTSNLLIKYTIRLEVNLV